MATINGDQLAGALNVTVRRVQQLVHEGMPQVDRGKYDLGQCYFWYVRYLQKALARRENVEAPPTKFQVYRERLLDAQASLEELALCERRGEMIPVQTYEQLLVGWAITIRQRLMALPGRLSSLLVGLERRAINEIIDREVREVLLILGNYQNGNEPKPVTGTSGGDLAVGRKGAPILSGTRNSKNQ